MKKIVCTTSFSNEELSKIKALALDCSIMEDTASILYARGYDTKEKIDTFLNPSKKHFHNPFLFTNMTAICNRIKLAKDNNENVLVYGDYDADGICASIILYNALKKYGINARAIVPNRDDGYGIHKHLIEQYGDEFKVSLVITVDCGISEYKTISEIKASGIDVIVTDHHEAPAILPDCLILNPKCDSNYPFNGLCGAGVSYKLATALIGKDAEEYLDFACVATIADSMELKNENRDIVYEGLKVLNAGTHPQFEYLLAGNNGKQITSQTISFYLGPRINAPGRVGDALCTLKLFLAEDIGTIQDLSAKTLEYNSIRQVECEKLYQEVKKKIKEEKSLGNVIMVYNEAWGTGFVGIVASKLVEEYGLPVILFSGFDGNLKGSARSVEGVNIYDAVSSASDLLVTFGGHAQAAGVTVTKENFSLFKKRVDDYIKEHRTLESTVPTIYVEKYIDKEITLQFAKEIERFEPTGIENRKPLFAIKVGRLNARPLKSGSTHLSFRTRASEMIYFNGVNNIRLLCSDFAKDLIFDCCINVYKGIESVKGTIKDVLVDVDDYSNVCAFENALKTCTINKEKIENVNLEYSTFAKIYHILLDNKDKRYTTATAFLFDNKLDVDYKEFIICTSVFIELGFFNVDNEVLSVVEGIKHQLNESAIYRMVNR